jgi:hypothetical protein
MGKKKNKNNAEASGEEIQGVEAERPDDSEPSEVAGGFEGDTETSPPGDAAPTKVGTVKERRAIRQAAKKEKLSKGEI